MAPPKAISDRLTLPWYDWVVFAAMLLVSVAIGIYHSLTGGKQRSTGEYLLGDRSMHFIPIMVSATVSYMSTITLLGYPAEMFAFGAQYWLGSIAIALGAILAALVFVPVFYPLRITSVNEYLELRFQSKAVKKLASAANILSMLLVTGNWYYAPSTAIEAVTSIPAWSSILLASAVSIFYTSIGGFKAVVWVDFFQSIVMLAGLLAVVIQGSIMMGGFSDVMDINREWGRLNFIVLDPDPTIRMNLWGVIFGMMFTWMGIFGFAQMGVQRYVSLPSLTQARLCVLGIIPGMVLISALSCLAGLLIFAYYVIVGCDPKKAHYINNYNQVLPYFVMDALRIPGFGGLIMACIFAGSLSSVSSAVNAMTANIWVDFLKEHFPNTRESTAAAINKVIAILCGLVATGFAFLMSEVGGTILQMIIALVSCVTGPTLAVFVFALFVPWINWKGACFGLISGFVFGVWLAIGYLLTDKNWTPLPSPSENCTVWDSPNNNTVHNGLYLPTTEGDASTVLSTTMEIATDTALDALKRFYSLSFLLHRDINACVSIVGAIIFSLFTGFRKPSTIPAKYMHPIMSYFVQLDTSEEEEDQEEKVNLSGFLQTEEKEHNTTDL